jgi:hypothetical protein
VTIEDPLVSRQHARIVVDDEQATVFDLGSRNGVKVNGVAVRQSVLLKDGDRIRIGTQELVFCRADVKPHASSAKTTGFLRHCAKCRLPYPQEVVQCPNCGSSEQMDEETLSGQFGAASQGSWSVQLLIEVLDKALSLGRVPDADRILRRATAQLEERIVRRESVDEKQLAALVLAAAKTSLEAGDSTWGVWCAQVYRRVTFLPNAEVVGRLGDLANRFPAELVEAIEQLAQHCRGAQRRLTPEETEALASLEQLRASLTETPGGARRSEKTALS